MNKISVNVVSESEISVKGHGVHTAYEEMVDALKKRDDVIVSTELKSLPWGKNADIVHFHTLGTYMWRKLWQKDTKKVVSAHVIPASFIGSIKLAKYWSFAARWYMSWFYNKCDKVLAVSATVARVLHDELRVPKNKIVVMYNTIHMAQYTPSRTSKKTARHDLKLREDDFVVIGNGQIQPRKRLDIFIETAKQLPEVSFIWVGGIPFKQLGADYANMQLLINELPSNVKVTGVISHQQVKKYLHAADVFMLPAEQENHPMAVLEAAGAHLPIILRDIPEYDDSFGQDVLRCKDDTFYDAVVLLRDDKVAYKKWQKKSRAIAERFDAKKSTEQLVKLYRQLI